MNDTGLGDFADRSKRLETGVPISCNQRYQRRFKDRSITETPLKRVEAGEKKESAA